MVSIRKMKTRLILDFSYSGSSLELVHITFYCSLTKQIHQSHRGKTGLLSGGRGAFQWTPGVVAVCLLAIKASLGKTFATDKKSWVSATGFCSRESSSATSLDFALSKQPNWLLDMFGCDSRGNSISKRLFIRINPEGRRAGPVRVAFNPCFLDPYQIKICINGQPVVGSDLGSVFENIISNQSVCIGRTPKANKQSSLTLSSAVSSAISDANFLLFQEAPLAINDYAPRLSTIQSSLLEFLSSRGESSPYFEDACPIPSLRKRNMSLTFCFDEKQPDILIVKVSPYISPVNTIAEAPLFGCPQLKEIRVVGDSLFRDEAKSLASYFSTYLEHLFSQLHRLLVVGVRALNPAIVDHIYLSLRAYLATLGMGKEGDKFSLFAHIDGAGRYLLDSARYEKVQMKMKSTSSLESPCNSNSLKLSLESEAWYCTSAHRSENTMSYTDAILPWQPWCGTPDIWKKPIPGFGSSEISVYGNGRTWAEPVNLGTDRTSVAMCAVYPDEFAPLLKGHFQTISSSFIGDPERISNSLRELRNASCSYY
jgi:hypothetical protein